MRTAPAAPLAVRVGSFVQPPASPPHARVQAVPVCRCSLYLRSNSFLWFYGKPPLVIANDILHYECIYVS